MEGVWEHQQNVEPNAYKSILQTKALQFNAKQHARYYEYFLVTRTLFRIFFAL